MNNKIKCGQCGVRVTAARFQRHLESVAHVNYDRIRALLKKDCIPFSDIAKRLRISRERVRQVALQIYKVRGRGRHTVCALARRDKQIEYIAANVDEVNPLFKELENICKANNFTFELIFSSGKVMRRRREGLYYRKVLKHRVKINGIECRVSDNKTTDNKCHIAPFGGRYLFVLLKSVGSWWVVPKSGARYGTTWSVNPSRPGANTDNHNQRQWKNNWGLLKV